MDQLKYAIHGADELWEKLKDERFQKTIEEHLGKSFVWHVVDGIDLPVTDESIEVTPA